MESFPKAPKGAYTEGGGSSGADTSLFYNDTQPILDHTPCPTGTQVTLTHQPTKPRIREALDRALQYMGTMSGVVGTVWFGTTMLTVNVGTYLAVKALIPTEVTGVFDYFVHGVEGMGLSDAAIYAALNLLGYFLLFSICCVSAQRTVTRAVTERAYDHFALRRQLPPGTHTSDFEGASTLYAVFCGGGCCDLRTLLRLVLFNVLNSLIVLVGLLCLVVPGVVAAIALSVGPAVIVVEQVGPITAIRRSVELVREKKLRTFQYWLLLLAVIVAVNGAARIVAAVVVALNHAYTTPATQESWDIATFLVYTLLVYFAAGFASIFMWAGGASYYHHRVVKGYYDKAMPEATAATVV